MVNIVIFVLRSITFFCGLMLMVSIDYGYQTIEYWIIFLLLFVMALIGALE